MQIRRASARGVLGMRSLRDSAGRSHDEPTRKPAWVIAMWGRMSRDIAILVLLRQRLANDTTSLLDDAGTMFGIRPDADGATETMGELLREQQRGNQRCRPGGTNTTQGQVQFGTTYFYPGPGQTKSIAEARFSGGTLLSEQGRVPSPCHARPTWCCAGIAVSKTAIWRFRPALD
jgi:hypothetical protein